MIQQPKQHDTLKDSGQITAKAEKIADDARNSISSYCSEECKAYCCRNGYLVLKEDEVDTVTQGRRKELIEKKLLKKIKGGKYSLFLGKHGVYCPSLKDFKCMIHDSPHRSKTCADFPVFLIKNKLRLSPRCLAVKENKLYLYVKQLLALGYRLEKTDFLDVDFSKCDELVSSGKR